MLVHLKTNAEVLDKGFSYIQVEAETGLAKDEWILGNCDEASLANQGARYQAEVNTIALDGTRFGVQKSQEG